MTNQFSTGIISLTLVYHDKSSHSQLTTFHQMGGPTFLDSLKEENKWALTF